MTDLEKQFKKISDNFEKHAYDDLKHFAEMNETLKRIEAKQDSQAVILEPIASTFSTASTLGKWLMPFLIAISLIVGIIWGLLQIFLYHKP